MPDGRVETAEEVATRERVARTHGARIAIVDNDPTLLSLLTEIFEDRGWKSIPYDDARLAAVSIPTHVPDLVLLDVWLATPTAGWELLAFLKRGPATRDIPVIVCSGAIDHLARGEACLKEHVAATVTKPFDVVDLSEAVISVLARRRASRQ